MNNKFRGWFIPLITSVSLTVMGTLIYTCFAIGQFHGQTQTEITHLKDQQQDLRRIVYAQMIDYQPTV